MLAYIFGHWKKRNVSQKVYEEKLLNFHTALKASSPEGFSHSVVFHIKNAPWSNNSKGSYEDWYILKGTYALDNLNTAAVSGICKDPHYRIAEDFSNGYGALYCHYLGTDEIVGFHNSLWFSKPKGISYKDFYNTMQNYLKDKRASLWKRMMGLGPSPEFCLFTNDSLDFSQKYVCIPVKIKSIWQGA